MQEFQEKYKIDVDKFTITGNSAAAYTKYYDMLGYRRVDFLVSMLVNRDVAGASGATDYQQASIAVYQATSNTGGGATALASATAIIGKDSGTGISTAAKCRDGIIVFSTLDKSTDLTIMVGTAAFQSASADTAAMRFVVTGSSANATVACQAFVTMFNDATQNTSTALTENWTASTEAAGVARVRISAKDPESTHLLHLGCTAAASLCNFGGVFNAHLGIDQQYLKNRFVALSIKSTEHANQHVVTIIREKSDVPATQVAFVSKSLNSSTSK